MALIMGLGFSAPPPARAQFNTMFGSISAGGNVCIYRSNATPPYQNQATPPYRITSVC